MYANVYEHLFTFYRNGGKYEAMLCQDQKKSMSGSKSAVFLKLEWNYIIKELALIFPQWLVASSPGFFHLFIDKKKQFENKILLTFISRMHVCIQYIIDIIHVQIIFYVLCQYDVLCGVGW